ncbi:hypothetical protein AMJ40_06120 [candidate division TA06 bacterium DG_26]|uniref:Uncharacterized protein n=1 Tax=candidate division TA06 bacterium DG_26 TaxID=1703771 RepID=A0A0S7WGD6_UNCT6|nr:MAG: hypothetical protein AMJ40_06120 [candidate division TA06 bacterium DG_26]
MTHPRFRHSVRFDSAYIVRIERFVTRPIASLEEGGRTLHPSPYRLHLRTGHGKMLSRTGPVSPYDDPLPFGEHTRRSQKRAVFTQKNGKWSLSKNWPLDDRRHVQGCFWRSTSCPRDFGETDKSICNLMCGKYYL